MREGCGYVEKRRDVSTYPRTSMYSSSSLRLCEVKVVVVVENVLISAKRKRREGRCIYVYIYLRILTIPPCTVHHP